MPMNSHTNIDYAKESIFSQSPPDGCEKGLQFLEILIDNDRMLI